VFESIEGDNTGIFQLTIRWVYLALAVLVDLTSLYTYLFPGSTRDEYFENFMLAGLTWVASLILSTPVFLYVFWQLVNHRRPMFWGIALLVAALPILTILVYFFYDLWFAG